VRLSHPSDQSKASEPCQICEQYSHQKDVSRKFAKAAILAGQAILPLHDVGLVIAVMLGAILQKLITMILQS